MASSHASPPEALHAELLAFLRSRTGCAHTAQDLAQESLLRGLGVAKRTPVQHWRGLLYRIARNLLADLGRQRVQTQPAEEAGGCGDAAADTAHQPEAALLARQQLQQLAAAIEVLPPRCREALDLVRFEGLSYREAAQRMGVSVNMVEKHLIRAMRALGVALNGDVSETR
jgi:RNA polymerase sigma-70 factor (ECF subfamily)